MISRGEAAGLTIALIGHIGLFGLLSVGFLATPNPLSLQSDPIEVSITDEAGLESQAPEINTEPPKTQMALEEGPAEPEAAPPEPEAKPEPPAKQPAQSKPVPDPEAAPAKPQKSGSQSAVKQPAEKPKSTGLLGAEFEKGLTAQPSPGKSDRPPATAIGQDVKSSLAAEVIRQIKPHWRPPSGADSDRLKTTVIVRLGEDGAIIGEPRIEQSGVTPSNSAQAALHKERAIRAVKLAAPFKLPDKFYNAWKTIAPTLYEGL